MPPPSAIEPHQNGDASKPSDVAPHEPGLSEAEAKVKMPSFPGPPKFDDAYKERAYLKGRLAGEESAHDIVNHSAKALTPAQPLSGYSANMASTRGSLGTLLCEIPSIPTPFGSTRSALHSA